MVRTFGQNQPVLVEQPPDRHEDRLDGRPEGQPERLTPRVRASRFGVFALTFAAALSLFWIGTCAAFLWGYWGAAGLAALSLPTKALAAAATLLPPFFFMAVAASLARGAAMQDAARQLLVASDRLLAADETSANNAARLARLVRRELDGLNAGLDTAFQRVRTLESVLEKQIAGLDEAGARAQVRGDSVAMRLNQEGARLEMLGDQLNEAASRAGETVAGRAAQLKATMESAEGTLKMATQSLDVQAAGFRAAITAAAEAPLEAAKTLEAQSARIEEVADAAMSRAEFVLARQEKHRAQMAELLQRLKDEGDVFDTAFARQRAGMEQAVGVLGAEVRRFEQITGDAEQHLEVIMGNAASRAAQLTNAFAREADRLKETGDAVGAMLAQLSAELRDSGAGAQALISDSTAQAKQDARLLVGEAMAECDRLLRAAGEMSAEAARIRGILAETTQDMEKHLIRLPGLAQEEARRVRQVMSAETEQLLDLSARAMSTLHARAGAGQKAPPAPDSDAPPAAPAAPEGDGLKGLARKLTARKPAEKGARKDGAPAWEMKTLLAAAEQGDLRTRPASGLDTAATLGALEVALADMAIDLAALDTAGPGDEDWKRYLAGDRAVFARRLADAIDEHAVDRITALYRDDRRFHDAADAYLSEFETLLARAREGDGGGLLTSTLLSADTGKVYLAIAYALGRL
ncbi:MAG TPA: hypothetical protein VHC40_13090 [Rhizomicrobium sp.]|nr:hypothetical protein [Rhizomicrobium sp.]